MKPDRPTLTLIDGNRSKLARELLQLALYGSPEDDPAFHAGLNRLARRARLQLVTPDKISPDQEDSD